jgi:hypothetical protein
VTSGGGLAGIDVADNDDVDVSLLVLTHFGGVLVVKFGWFVWRFETARQVRLAIVRFFVTTTMAMKIQGQAEASSGREHTLRR